MFERLMYPVLVFGFIAITWVLLGKVPREGWDLVPGLLSLPAILLVAYLEKTRPHRAAWQNNYGDKLSDLVHTFLLFPVVLKIAQVAASVIAFHPLHLIPVGWPLLVQFLIGLSLAELVFYAFHRAAHEIPFLWAFHRVHHGAGRVYWANAGRFNPIDLGMIMTIYFLPLYLIAFPPEVIVLVLAANVITGLLEHSNIRFDAGLFNYIFNSAQLHRWHHSQILQEANQNYGKVLCVWDVALKTWFLPKERSVGDVGVCAGERAVPNDLLGQAFDPFVRQGVSP